MKKLLVVAAFAALGSTVAQSADMAARTYIKAPMVDPSYSWSGFYIGGDVGEQWSRLGLADPRNGPLTYNPESDGIAGGGHIGYQHQWGQLVLGVEGSYIAASGSNNFTTPSINIFSVGGSGTASTKLKDIWGIGGRAGWALNNWLPYITGGYADGRFGFDAATNPPFDNVQHATPRFGGAYLGGGLEWAPMNSNWIVGVEYRHYYFDAKTVAVPVTGTGAFIEQIDFRPKADTVMGRLSYKFGSLFGAY